jgi:hypothetical protein
MSVLKSGNGLVSNARLPAVAVTDSDDPMTLAMLSADFDLS